MEQYTTVLRKQTAEGERLASETEAALGELKPLEELMRQPPGGEPALDTGAALNLTRDLLKGFAQRQTLVRQILTGLEGEACLWNAYYDGIAALTRAQCAEFQPPAAKRPPAALPAKGR